MRYINKYVAERIAKEVEKDWVSLADGYEHSDVRGAIKAAIAATADSSIDLMQFREAVITWAEVAENDLTSERYEKAMRLLKIIDDQDGEEK